MPDKWYVFLNQDTQGYEIGQISKQTERCLPISLPYKSAALAHDNMITRQFFPLNERQLHAIEALKRPFGNGGPKAAARNQTFLDALILENRWRAGELRPAIACRDAVRMVFDPTYTASPMVQQVLAALDVGGSAPRPRRRQVRRLHERELEREVGK